MQSLHYFFLLAPDYDELVIPSSFAEFAPDSQKRNVAKAFQYFIAKNDFSVFQRQPRESPEEWSQRLSSECGLGAFAEYVSPPRQIRAKNGRFYEGNTALLLMRRADENTMRNVLLVTAILSDLDRERNYDISTILDCVPEPFHSACRPILEEIGVVLESSGGVLSGKQWKAWLPAGTIQKAQEWCDRSECPAFFGEPPTIFSLEEADIPDQALPPIPEKESERVLFGFSPLLLSALLLMLSLGGVLWRVKDGTPPHPENKENDSFLIVNEPDTYPFDRRDGGRPATKIKDFDYFRPPPPPGVYSSLGMMKK